MTPEQKLGLSIDERTRFRIRFTTEDAHGRMRPKTIRCLRSLKIAQLAYIAEREATGLGNSRFTSADVFDESGQHVAEISYNGRLWAPGEWKPGDECIAEAPLIMKIADFDRKSVAGLYTFSHYEHPNGAFIQIAHSGLTFIYQDPDGNRFTYDNLVQLRKEHFS